MQEQNTLIDCRGKKKDEVISVARACDIICAFRHTNEILRLRDICARVPLHKVTIFRIMETLVKKGIMEKVGAQGYRSHFQPFNVKRYRFGYAAMNSVVPFISSVTESLADAAEEANVDLVILNNKESRKEALHNADIFVREKVDLVIEFQLHAEIAPLLVSRYANARIPMISIDVPHPGAYYYGADNYKAGRMGGVHLGRWAAHNWQGQIDEILLLGTVVAGPVIEARTSGMLEGIHRVLPHITEKPVYRYDTRVQFDRTLETVRKHLRRRQSQHILVGAGNDMTALAALQAFRDYGMEQNCAIIGQDGVADARQELRRPQTRLIGTVGYFPESYGKNLIRIALEILHKQMVPLATFTHHELITPENVNKVYSNDLLLELKSVHSKGIA